MVISDKFKQIFVFRTVSAKIIFRDPVGVRFGCAGLDYFGKNTDKPYLW